MKFKTLACVVVLVAASAPATLLSSPAAHAAASYQDCGEKSFGGGTVESSHYGVKDIGALRTSCQEARAVATAVQNAHDYKYNAHGYHCVGGTQTRGIRPYSCTKLKADRQHMHDKVRFKAVGLG